LFAVETLEPDVLDKLPDFKRRLEWFIENRPDLTANIACMRTEGMGERRLLSIADADQLRAFSSSCWMSASSFRRTAFARSRSSIVTIPTNSTSRAWSIASTTSRESLHRTVRRQLQLARPHLVPGELSCWSSRCRKFHHYLGDDFKVEFPTGSGK
jgi:hypothetical protein